MSYHLDEYEIEMSHERERRFERDDEREPPLRTRRSWKRPRYVPSWLVANGNATDSAEKEAA